jgi:hypothetical protein
MLTESTEKLEQAREGLVPMARIEKTVFVSYPRDLHFDFKQPTQIIDAHAKRASYARFVGALAYLLSIVGLVWMAALFLH